MKKTMFPRSFVLWKDEVVIHRGGDKYWIIKDCTEGDFQLTEYNLDKLYQYWRLEIEPKTKEDEKE